MCRAGCYVACVGGVFCTGTFLDHVSPVVSLAHTHTRPRIVSSRRISKSPGKKRKRKKAPGDPRHLSLSCTMYMFIVHEASNKPKHTTGCPLCVCSHPLLPGSPISPDTEKEKQASSPFFVLHCYPSVSLFLLVHCLFSSLFYVCHIAVLLFSPLPHHGGRYTCILEAIACLRYH